jgi:catechol 2,3-dioxygenase-like lactoylglutathione lyase family enzyme
MKPGTSAHHEPTRLRWPIWIGIVCDDLDRQRRFYRDVLGLSEVKHEETAAWFDLEGRLLELSSRTALPQSDERRVSVGFEVDDIEAARAGLVARGVEAISDIDGGPESGSYWTYLRDAEGNVFELVQQL